MAQQYICQGEKYIFSNRTIALPVLFEALPNEIEVEGYKLLLKSSFHVSLACIGKIIEKHKVLIPDFEDLVIKDFCEFTSKFDVSLIGYDNKFRFVSQNEKRTVVFDVSNLEFK